MFLISFPYRLALGHCDGLFFRCLTWSVSFFFFDCPSEEGAHSCLETSWEKSETKSSVKNEFFVFCPVSIVFCRGIRISLIKYISVDRHYNAIWTKNKRRSRLLLSCEDVEAMLHCLLDNVFIQVGGKVFQQCTCSRLVCAICEAYGCTANATWRSERPRSNAPAKGSFAPTEGKLKKHPLFRCYSLRLEAQAPLQLPYSTGWQLDWLKLET